MEDDQMQRRADNGHDEGGVPAASAHTQQQEAAKTHEQQQQQPASSLNPTAARLLREAIVSQPADGGKPAPAAGSSDILAFARSVDRVDSPLE